MGRMEKGTSGEAAVHVDASPAEVYAVLSDVTRMGEWSPETVRCEWIDGATGPAVGAPSRAPTSGGSPAGPRSPWSSPPSRVASSPSWSEETTKWAFRCEPEGTGTRLVESFEMLEDVPLTLRLGRALHHADQGPSAPTSSGAWRRRSSASSRPSRRRRAPDHRRGTGRVGIDGSRRARMGTDIARRHFCPGDAPHLGVPMVRPPRVGTGPVRPTRRPPGKRRRRAPW